MNSYIGLTWVSVRPMTLGNAPCCCPHHGPRRNKSRRLDTIETDFSEQFGTTRRLTLERRLTY